MSIEATSWALKETRLNRPDLRLMLIFLSEFHSGGTVSVMPELSVLAESFPCSEDKGYVAVFNRWRDNEGNTSMSRSERFCIPTTNGYEVCTDLGGFKNHA